METDELPEITTEMMVGADLKLIKVEKMEIEDEVFSDLPMTLDFQNSVKEECIIESVEIKSEIQDVSEFNEELDIKDEIYIVKSPDKEHVKEDTDIKDEVLESSELKKEESTEDNECAFNTSNQERIVQDAEQNWKLETAFDDCCSLCICFKLNSDGSHYAACAEHNKNGQLVSISGKRNFHVCDDYCIKSKPSFLYESAMNAKVHCKHGIERYTCDKCQSGFASKRSLQSHIIECMGQCKSSIQKEHLAVRTKIQTNKCSYECSECGKGFSRLGILQNHMNTHTAEQPCKCNKCHKTFTGSKTLKMHMKIHAGEYSYKCSECYKTFISSQTLKSHMRIHTGEYRCKCPECGKKFYLFSIMKDHMNTHTGERPYKCNECYKTFISSKNLKYHMKIHTGEYRSKCIECGKGFRGLCILEVSYEHTYW